MIDDLICLACKCTYETGCKLDAENAAKAAGPKSDTPQNVPYHRIIVRKRNYPGVRGEALAATAARREARNARRASKWCGTR